MPIRRSKHFAVRRDQARFSKYLADLQQSDLTQTTGARERDAPIQGCLHTVFEEELGHLGAARDLDLLETD
jgi:hypothetical protein